MLRREGLYSSHVIEWRQARDAGVPARPAGGQPAADPADAQIARLRKEKAKLEQEMAKARFVEQPETAAAALSHPAVSVDAHQHAREEIEQRAHVCLPHADDVLISVPGAFISVPDNRGIAAFLANRHR